LTVCIIGHDDTKESQNTREGKANEEARAQLGDGNGVVECRKRPSGQVQLVCNRHRADDDYILHFCAVGFGCDSNAATQSLRVNNSLVYSPPII
jgi:hypothetical protein